MYVIRQKEVITVSYEKVLAVADNFFNNNTSSILYVLQKEILIGIVTKADYDKNFENGNIINTHFKRLYMRAEKTEEELLQEAQEIFARCKNISELPVVDSKGRLCFSFVRKGGVYDVLPNRFLELYGINREFADYVVMLKEKHITVSADTPQLLLDYLNRYTKGKTFEIRRAFIDAQYEAEELFKEFEYWMFQKRVLEFRQKLVFLELPILADLCELSEEEKIRIRNAKEKTMLYYLENCSYDKEARDLAKRVLGKDSIQQELIDALKTVARISIKGGLCYNVDFISNYVNVVNGKRVTTDVPDVSDGEIYMFGPCTVFGVLAEDYYTIPSCLQRLLNGLGLQREVVNEGMDAAPLLESIRKFNRSVYRENDIFIFIIWNANEKKWIRRFFPDLIIQNLALCYNSFGFHDYFFDLPSHPNWKANEKIAAYILKFLCIPEVKEEKGKLLQPMIASSNFITEEIEVYLNYIKQFYCSGVNGAIVMNCNPFTNGHLYLIVQASLQVEHLYIFVVSEDRSCFPFMDRIQLVKEGIKGYVDNVTVLSSGKYILSYDTFPEYFSKDNISSDTFVDTSLDLELFSKYIAPMLDIKVRFVGEEPYDVVTRQYNHNMQRILPQYGIQVVCMPRRRMDQNEYISASAVRRFWREGNKEEVKKRVPDSTYRYLFTNER